jgi:hypothetical protein
MEDIIPHTPGNDRRGAAPSKLWITGNEMAVKYSGAL